MKIRVAYLLLLLLFIPLVSANVNTHTFTYQSDLGAAGPIGRGAMINVNETVLLLGVGFTTEQSDTPPAQVYVANASSTSIIANFTTSGFFANASRSPAAPILLYANENYFVIANGSWTHLPYTNGRIDNATINDGGISVKWQWRPQFNTWPTNIWDTANGVMGGVKNISFVSCTATPSYPGCPAVTSLPNFVYNTPADKTITINVSVISVNCSNGNAYLWVDNNTNPVTPILTNVSVASQNWTFNYTQTGYYYYKAQCFNQTSGFSLNSSINLLTYITGVSTGGVCSVRALPFGQAWAWS